LVVVAAAVFAVADFAVCRVLAFAVVFGAWAAIAGPKPGMVLIKWKLRA